MKRRNWYILLGVLMVALSALVYFFHFVVFRDVHHIFIYLVGDVAFVFLEVLMVTLIIHTLLTERDKRVALNKMNMVIGAFFSQVGTQLLKTLAGLDPDPGRKEEALGGAGKWKDRDFVNMQNSIEQIDFDVDSRAGELDEIRGFLVGNRDFMLRLLENPLLLEHESFTDLLWAVFHLTEELANRESLDGLPDSDYEHLSTDMSRAYGRLVREWIGYMLHLKRSYPYLFSLAVRMNPFDPEAYVVVDQ